MALNASRKVRIANRDLDGQLGLCNKRAAKRNAIDITVPDGDFHDLAPHNTAHGENRRFDHLFDGPGAGEVIVFRKEPRAKRPYSLKSVSEGTPSLSAITTWVADRTSRFSSEGF